MKIAIIEVCDISANPIDAHYRNAVELCSYLKSKGHYVVFMANNSPTIMEKFDVVIHSYASLYFDFKKYDKFRELNHQAKYVWMTNEYNITMNGWTAEKVTHVISNFENKSLRKYKTLVLNLNTLLFKDRNAPASKKYDLCYYGTFRVNREVYFKKYLKDNLILSTSPKNHKKFKDIGCTSKYTGKFHWQPKKETLNLFRASLYIEDTYTHTCFNHLANRYYEALTCNTALFFDENCAFTLSKSKCVVDDFFIVKSLEEINDRLLHPDFDTKTESFLCKNAALAKQDKIEVLEQIEKFLISLIASTKDPASASSPTENL